MMIKYRFNLVMILFFFLTTISFVGCSTTPKKEQFPYPYKVVGIQDKVVGIQDEGKGSELSGFILGEGDTIDVAVYRKRTPEFILGVGDAIDVSVYRKKSSEFVLVEGDTIDVAVYRKRTPEFILGVGDAIDVSVYRKNKSEFIFGAGDSLELSVYRHADLDRSVQVDSNGMIMLSLIGDIQASGKTAAELRDEIQKRLSKYIVDPQVTVNISERQPLKIDSLSQSFTIRAQKAGKIMFPIIGELQAAGRHVNDLTKEIQQKLSKHFIDPEVTVNTTPIQTMILEDLSIRTKISPTGKIMLPLIGDVFATGKDTFQLRDEIQKRLSKYIVDPQVTVNISERQPLKIDSLSQSFTIRAQKAGKIMFPVIGEVQAAGRHVNDLTKELQQKLSKHFVDPEVTINTTPIQTLVLEDLAVTIRLGSTGKIMFPLIGDVLASGKGVFELRDEIQKRLSKYIVDPQVTINVSTIASQKIYVLGEVNSPGAFAFNRKISTLEAILEAEGFTLDANEDAVLLVRSKEGMAELYALNLNIGEMAEEDGKSVQNVSLKNQDVIYVPPKTIVSVERFMGRLRNMLGLILDIGRGFVIYESAYRVLTGQRTATGVIY